MTDMQLVVVPKTGEMIDLKQASTASIAMVLDAISAAERDLKSDRRAISDEVARRLDVHGKRSIETDGWRLEINGPTEREYDIDELRGVLAELVTEGTITEAKAKACIRHKPEVVWSELKILTTDPRCEARINHAITIVPATRYVRAKNA